MAIYFWVEYKFADAQHAERCARNAQECDCRLAREITAYLASPLPWKTSARRTALARATAQLLTSRIEGRHAGR